MDKASAMMFPFFNVLIIININEIRNLIMPAKKVRIEIIGLSVGVLNLLIIILLYGKIWAHYIVGFLGIAYIFLSWAKRRITPKGFNSVIGLARFQKWDKLSYVEIFPNNNDDFKVLYLNTGLRKDSYYYKKEDYDRVVNILSEKLPSEKTRMLTN